jgi:hypothetical protein
MLQILPEISRAYLRVEVRVRAHDEPHVDAMLGCVVAESTVAALLRHL